MKENINLCEILKDCPKGTKFYSPVLGYVTFEGIQDNTDNDFDYCILVSALTRYDITTKVELTREGRYNNLFIDSECILWPSKDVRTWEGWQYSKPKFDPNTFKPFDKVLARIKHGMWYADFISLPIDELNPVLCIMGDKDFDTIIPYNDDTKHLLCTTKDAPEYYRYWED